MEVIVSLQMRSKNEYEEIADRLPLRPGRKRVQNGPKFLVRSCQMQSWYFSQGSGIAEVARTDAVLESGHVGRFDAQQTQPTVVVSVNLSWEADQRERFLAAALSPRHSSVAFAE